MEPVTRIEGGVPLDRSDVDTDQIVPAQFLKRIERTGFGPFLFHEWRKDPSFVLNDERYAGASMRDAGANFGGGSSREHAPWALEDFGFRAVIAPSFADIFRNNCCKIGLLPVELPQESVRALMDAVLDDPTTDRSLTWRPSPSRALGRGVVRVRRLPALVPARGLRRHRPDDASRRRDRGVRGGTPVLAADRLSQSLERIRRRAASAVSVVSAASASVRCATTCSGWVSRAAFTGRAFRSARTGRASPPSWVRGRGGARLASPAPATARGSGRAPPRRGGRSRPPTVPATPACARAPSPWRATASAPVARRTPRACRPHPRRGRRRRRRAASRSRTRRRGPRPHELGDLVLVETAAREDPRGLQIGAIEDPSRFARERSRSPESRRTPTSPGGRNSRIRVDRVLHAPDRVVRVHEERGAVRVVLGERRNASRSSSNAVMNECAIVPVARSPSSRPASTLDVASNPRSRSRARPRARPRRRAPAGTRSRRALGPRRR